MKRYLYLMLGHPGSGKSYFAQQLAAEIGAVRFNSDRMRHHLFKDPHEHHSRSDHEHIVNAINCAAISVLQSGYSIIYDINNNFVSDRRAYAALSKEHGACTVIIWIKTPLEVATERGASRPLSQEHIRIDPAWVERVAAELETPSLDELYIEIDGTLEFQRQYSSFRNQLSKLKCQFE